MDNETRRPASETSASRSPKSDILRDPPNSRLFISYRREDTEHAAARMGALLKAYVPVFRDRESIPVGADAPREIGDAVLRCQYMLVAIGKRWVGAKDATGHGRICQPGDWVASEIRLALELGRIIVPVLLDGASMPSQDEVPEQLRPLLSINAKVVSNENFEQDVENLAAVLGITIGGAHATLLIRPAPSIVPDRIYDRTENVDRLLDAVTSGTDRVLALTGPAGTGKTAVVSALFRELTTGRAAGVFGSVDYIAANGYMTVTAASLVEALAEAVPDPELRSELRSPARRARVIWADRVEEVLQSMERPAFVVIDQTDDLLVDDGSFQDTALNQLLQEITRRKDHRVTVLLVGRRQPQPQVGWRLTCLELDEGLPLLEASQLLQALTRGIAPDERLLPKDWAVTLTDGHPRSLELVVAALAIDPVSEARTFRHIAVLDRHERLTALVDHVLMRLDGTATAVIRALAALGLPADADEVEMLLDGTPAADDARATLEYLSRVHFLRRTRPGQYYLPRSPDAERVLDQLEAQGHGSARKQELLLRAAAAMAARKRRAPVQRVEDLAPHFREIDLLLQAGEVDRPNALMEALDLEHLTAFGHKYVLVPWRKRVAGRLDSAQHERANFSAMAAAARQQTAYSEAFHYLESAQQTLADDGDEVEALTLLRQEAAVLYLEGRVEDAEHKVREAVARAYALPPTRRGRDWAVAAAHVDQAGYLTELGRFDQARFALDETPLSRIGDADRMGSQLHANLMLCLASIHRCNGEFAKSRRALGRAEAHAGGYSQPQRARCVDARAAVYLDEGLVDEAVLAAEEASRIVSASGAADLSRQANATLAFAYLSAGRLDDARRAANDAARFSRSRRIVNAHLLQGMVALRSRDGSTADAAFHRALANTWALTSLAPKAFVAHDSHALALTGLVLCSVPSDSYRAQAIQSFQRARGVTHAPGVVRRITVLLSAMTAHSGDSDVLADIQAAATGTGSP